MTLRSISKYSWFSFIPFVVAAPIIVALMFMGVITKGYLWGTLAGWILISGLGIAVGYHRVFSHRTHILPAWKENLLLFLGALGGQGSSITWSAIHRGYHHRGSDTPIDLHSPHVYGKWHAFFGWTLDITEEKQPFSLKYAVDLMRKKNHVWFHNHQLKIQWLTPFAIACFDWKLSLSLIVLPCGLSLLQDNLVNVFGHVKGFIGYRNFDISDQSQNNFLLGYFGWGQGWHNNHHADPAAFDFGKKWWEYDPCRIFLPFL